VTGLPEVRPEVVALWLGSDAMAASEAGRLVRRDGAPFTDAELDLARSCTPDERAVVLERAELRLAEAEAMLADAVARHKAAKRAKYRDYRRRRGERRGRSGRGLRRRATGLVRDGHLSPSGNPRPSGR
jgi:hypothetical protein